MNSNIVTLRPDQIDAAAEILTEAGLMDPVMGFLFGSDLDVRRRGVLVTMSMLCRVRVGQGNPLLGLMEGDQLAAVACIALPGQPSWPSTLREAWSRMEGTVGGEAVDRLEIYCELHDRHDIDADVVYVDAIGVHTDAKGKGYSAELLEQVIRLSREHPDAIGVALDTAIPANVNYYQGLGFGVKASDGLKATQVYFMFRGNE